uniref:uncharacterized protein LOC122604336 n=1 Tax=Erigeron canadensis TaxID=72917 RepID=UPI001CB91974|nr:uncharacterized protein LOC122604336 [Erigeron canadensis]
MASGSSASSTNRATRYHYCNCGEKMYILTSWTSRNPGRRFVRCPNVKSRSCTTFNFIDEELPNQYYKDLLMELRSETNKYRIDEQDESKEKLVKVLEELTYAKSKDKFVDKVFYFPFGVVIMLCIVIALVMMN